jgi:hypothetical protein
MATLTNGTSVTLPDTLEWVDEFDFTAVAQRTGRTITGALWVEELALAAGRPITLQSGEDRAWVKRAVLETMLAWAQTPGATLTLNWRGADYSVIFDRQQGKPIEARLVEIYDDVDAGDDYVVTLRFLQVP